MMKELLYPQDIRSNTLFLHIKYIEKSNIFAEASYWYHVELESLRHVNE